MPRKKKQSVKINNVYSLEGVLQEIYNEACNNIKSAQIGINELTASAEPDDTDDHVKVAKAKTDFLKTKTDNVRVKLEVAKLQNDSVKHAGSTAANLNDAADTSVNSKEQFKNIRQMIIDNANAAAKEPKSDIEE